MKNLLFLVPVVVLSYGCHAPEARTVATDQTAAISRTTPQTQDTGSQDESAGKEKVVQRWDEWPNFTTDLPLIRTNMPLERTLPFDYTDDPQDLLVRLDGIKINGSKAAVRLTDVGSGIFIYVVTLYLLKDEQWDLRYRYEEPISLATGPITEVRAQGSDLFLKADAHKEPWETTILLPGNVDQSTSE